MDRRKFNGGNKNAGRKPKAEEVALIEKLTPLHDLAMDALKKGLENGQYQFVQLYMSYYYGKPKETKDITVNKDLPLFID